MPIHLTPKQKIKEYIEEKRSWLKSLPEFWPNYRYHVLYHILVEERGYDIEDVKDVIEEMGDFLD